MNPMMINPGMMPMPMNSMMINPINTNSMINIISLINSPIFVDAHSHPLILCLIKQELIVEQHGNVINIVVFFLMIFLHFIVVFVILIYAKNV